MTRPCVVRVGNDREEDGSRVEWSTTVYTASLTRLVEDDLELCRAWSTISARLTEKVVEIRETRRTRVKRKDCV